MLHYPLNTNSQDDALAFIVLLLLLVINCYQLLMIHPREVSAKVSNKTTTIVICFIGKVSLCIAALLSFFREGLFVVVVVANNISAWLITAGQ